MTDDRRVIFDVAMRIPVTVAISGSVLLWGMEALAQAPAPAPEPAPPSEATTEVMEPEAPAPATAQAQPSPAPSESPAPVVAVAPVPAPSEDRDAIAHAITQLEEEKDRTASLGGPITLLAIGGGTCIVGANFVLIGLSRRVVDESLDGTNNGLGTAFIAVGGVGLVAGAGMAIGGGLWLRNRLQIRRALNLEIEELEHQLEPPVATLRLTPTLGPGAYGLSLSGAF